jgi:ubiquinone/menaquinone biosynthesis C-methylase UbiE
MPNPNPPEHYSMVGKQAEHPEKHAEHLSQMVEYYNRTAKMYDLWHFSAKNSHDYAVETLIKTMRAENLKTVLDICCGTGRAISSAQEAGFDAHGIDISPGLLAEAANKRNIPKDRLHLGDATKLPFPDKSFDATCILAALHHTAMPHTIIEEMIRVTRRVMIVSDCGNRLHGGVRSALIKAGVFRPVYRSIFKREPKTERRQLKSDGDGPTFDFSIEEVIPVLKKASREMKFLIFYGTDKRQFASRYFPRLFAKHVVATCCLR